MSQQYRRGYDMVAGSQMTYGKHRGKDCKWIAYNDPSYILWAKKQTDWRICGKLLEAAQNRQRDLCHG
ncbi:hypothetical protein MHBO_004802 [Bonamia ostreae]|uniref:Uncharacterized protein n=1 Tax=Bonamia ostreae TaxID=126728 RepID=A0ABV2AV42_9EUKA